jgi:2-polyprenyl-3-methyl-5-hydroxy-6-metoxy-1,4-benzoquinol methylase
VTFDRVDPPNASQLAAEWDALGPIRATQIANRSDISYWTTTRPFVLGALIAHSAGLRVLDAGTGTGELASEMSRRGYEVTGIDPSKESVALASENEGDVTYVVSTLEAFADEKQDGVYDVVTANMVLMDVHDLGTFYGAAAQVLNAGGVLIATITHPFFWPAYWGYDKENWFSYLKETFVRGSFRTSSQETALVSTHVHRPIDLYMSAALGAGLNLLELRELAVKADGPDKPPRFIGLVFSKPLMEV